MAQLIRLSSIPESEISGLLRDLRAIFFESSNRKTFADQKARDDFFETWVGYYLRHCSDQTLLAVEGSLVLGYLTGCFDTNAALSELESKQPFLREFIDLFAKFPAHLHINCAEHARGKGVGSALIQKFKSECMEQRLAGVHIITSPNSRNVSFYKKNGFIDTTEKTRNSTVHLFMGCPLQ